MKKPRSEKQVWQYKRYLVAYGRVAGCLNNLLNAEWEAEKVLTQYERTELRCAINHLKIYLMGYPMRSALLKKEKETKNEGGND